MCYVVIGEQTRGLPGMQYLLCCNRGTDEGATRDAVFVML